MTNYTNVSKYLSMILRHKPEAIGITLDAHGWADVDELIQGIAKTYTFNKDILEIIVRTDAKQRYAFNDDHTKIRANQGHSVPVDLELTPVPPPDVLYHGTGEKYTVSIDRTGLQPKQRLHVHLSKDMATAKTVGSRHGNPVIYQIDSAAMYRDGHAFYQSANGVWLTNAVPVQYLKKL